MHTIEDRLVKVNTNAELALALYEGLGIFVTPCASDGPMAKDPIPNDVNWITRKMILRWWNDHRMAIPGICTGTISNLMIVEFANAQALKDWQQRYGRLPKTLIARTRTGSTAVFVERPHNTEFLQGTKSFGGIPGVTAYLDGEIFIGFSRFDRVAPLQAFPSRWYLALHVRIGRAGTGRAGTGTGCIPSCAPKGSHSREYRSVTFNKTHNFQATIADSVPLVIDTANGKLFELIGKLKPLVKSQQYAEELFREWYSMAKAKGTIGHGFKTYLNRFRSLWKRWDPLKQLRKDAELAKNISYEILANPRARACYLRSGRPNDLKKEQLLIFCVIRANKDPDFYLSCRDAGKLFNVIPMTANRWLSQFVSEGKLLLVKIPGFRKAFRYRIPKTK